VNAYVSLLRTPGVARIIAAQLTARFPSGMLSLGFLLHMHHIFGSYGSAGLVLAATSVGQGLSGPLTSRWMGVWGMRSVLMLTTSVCALSLLTVALAPLPLVGFMVAGLVAGLSYPPVQPAVRTIYPKMVNSRQLTPLFSLDASAQEIIWIAGPVVVTLIATQISTTVGMMQQASALGQFLAPPVVAWLAHRVGGWQWTWVVTLACSVVGIAAFSPSAIANSPIV